MSTFKKALLKQRQKDRRQHARVLFFAPVDIALRGRVFKDFIHDISAGGAFIETNTKKMMHTIIDTPLRITGKPKVTMTFLSPDRAPIKVNGKIVRIDTKGIGVAFTTQQSISRHHI